MNEPSGAQAKKAYSPPALSKYGDLATMTTSVSLAAKLMDGGNNSLKSG
jgi:hypothetical protein